MNEFYKNNKKVLQLIQIFTEDYLGARCCLLNGLLNPGYILAEQAIEKELKSLILILSPKESFKKNKLYPYHDCSALLKRLQNITKLNLVPYENLVFVLSNTYHSLRYPDNDHLTTSGIYSLSTKLIDDLDEMFIELFVQLPIPDDIKCLIGIQSILKIKKYETELELLIKANKAYSKRLDYFSRTIEWWEMSAEERNKIPQIAINYSIS